jgi:hypothetical protein
MIKNTTYNILRAVVVLFWLWIGVSFIDIVIDNCSAAPVHSNFNAFILFLEVFNN